MAIYQQQGGIRTLPLSAKEVAMLTAASNAVGVDVHVFSGGQPPIGSGGSRTGSTRHDNGNAADLTLWQNGRQLDWANPSDLPTIQSFVGAAVENGATGIGAGPGYMTPGSLHVGFGAGNPNGGPMLWGAGGTTATAPTWLRQAAGNIPLGATKDIGPNVNPAEDPFGVVRMQLAAQGLADIPNPPGSPGAAQATLQYNPNHLMRGPQVTALQNALIAKGIPVTGGADGVYGKGTAKAVAAFERANPGMAVEQLGVAGPQVLGALGLIGSGNAGSLASLSNPQDPTLVGDVSPLQYGFGQQSPAGPIAFPSSEQVAAAVAGAPSAPTDVAAGSPPPQVPPAVPAVAAGPTTKDLMAALEQPAGTNIGSNVPISNPAIDPRLAFQATAGSGSPAVAGVPSATPPAGPIFSGKAQLLPTLVDPQVGFGQSSPYGSLAVNFAQPLPTPSPLDAAVGSGGSPAAPIYSGPSPPVNPNYSGFGGTSVADARPNPEMGGNWSSASDFPPSWTRIGPGDQVVMLPGNQFKVIQPEQAAQNLGAVSKLGPIATGKPADQPLTMFDIPINQGWDAAASGLGNRLKDAAGGVGNWFGDAASGVGNWLGGSVVSPASADTSGGLGTNPHYFVGPNTSPSGLWGNFPPDQAVGPQSDVSGTGYYPSPTGGLDNYPKVASNDPGAAWDAAFSALPTSVTDAMAAPTAQARDYSGSGGGYGASPADAQGGTSSASDTANKLGNIGSPSGWGSAASLPSGWGSSGGSALPPIAPVLAAAALAPGYTVSPDPNGIPVSSFDTASPSLSGSIAVPPKTDQSVAPTYGPGGPTAFGLTGTPLTPPAVTNIGSVNPGGAGSINSGNGSVGHISGMNLGNLMAQVTASGHYAGVPITKPSDWASLQSQGYTMPNFQYNPSTGTGSGGANYAYLPNGQGGGTYVDQNGKTWNYSSDGLGLAQSQSW